MIVSKGPACQYDVVAYSHANAQLYTQNRPGELIQRSLYPLMQDEADSKKPLQVSLPARAVVTNEGELARLKRPVRNKMKLAASLNSQMSCAKVTCNGCATLHTS